MPKKKQDPTDEMEVVLDTSLKSEFIKNLEEELYAGVIGQKDAVEKIVDASSRLSSGIRNKERPILTLMLLGPTGVGKTESVKVLAKALLGNRKAFTRINCQELSESHTVSKLLGSPPGYVDGDIEPLLSQEKLDKHCEEAWENKKGIFSMGLEYIDKIINPVVDKNLSIILFDEIEKAHPNIWTSLLSILDDGHLILSNNETVDMTNSIIVMTSNIGSRQILSKIESNSIGFDTGVDSNKDLSDMAIEEMKSYFPPEFSNRFDCIIPFKVLDKKSLKEIVYIHLSKMRKEMFDCDIPVDIIYTKRAIDKIIDEGFSQSFGARELNRTIQNTIMTPISKLVSTKQILPCDIVKVKPSKEGFNFIRQPRIQTQKVLKKGKK